MKNTSELTGYLVESDAIEIAKRDAKEQKFDMVVIAYVGYFYVFSADDNNLDGDELIVYKARV